MAKNTHTGGENAVWEFHNDYIAARGPRGGLVFLGRALSVDGDEIKRRANARLMAAAPEMLRALRMLDDEKLLHAISGRTLEAIDKAVRKATGGEG